MSRSVHADEGAQLKQVCDAKQTASASHNDDRIDGSEVRKVFWNRSRAAVMMLEGIAFLAIITAAITSSFVARAQREQALVEGAEEAAFDARIEARLDELAARFDQLDAMLREQSKR